MSDEQKGKLDGLNAGWNGHWYPDLREKSHGYRIGFAKGYCAGTSL